jgi:hypothetical protein
MGAGAGADDDAGAEEVAGAEEGAVVDLEHPAIIKMTIIIATTNTKNNRFTIYASLSYYTVGLPD